MLAQSILGERRESDVTPATPQPGARSMAPGARFARALAHNAGDALAMSGVVARALVDSGKHPIDAVLGLAAGARRVIGFSRG